MPYKDPEKARQCALRLYYRHREKSKASRRKYYHKNREKCRASNQAWLKAHKDRIPEYQRRWKKKNREKWNAYCLKRRRTNINARLAHQLRDRISKAVKLNLKSAKTLDLLGCSIESFKIYIESKFDVGMSWENYGYRGWHLDHIVPCALFDLTKPDHQARCFHFSNLAPMWHNENFKKGKRVTNPQLRLI
jgi:Prasinovirus endonuclease VII